MTGNLSARLLPAVQVLALACLSAFGLQFVEMLVSPLYSTVQAAVMLAAVLTSTAAIAVLWYLRSHLSSHRARLGCVLAATVVLAAITVFGQFTMAVPAIILTVTLLVIESGWRAGAAGGLIFLTVWGTTALALSPDPLWSRWLSIVSMVALAGIGMALGLLLNHNAAALEAQRQAVTARDEALAHLRRQGALEKELLLAHERDRAARELHDGLGHRLTLVSMSLELAERTRHRSPEVAWQEVTSARTATIEAMEDMRTWVRALSPTRSQQATDIQALEAVASSFRTTGLRVELDNRVGGHLALPAPMGLLMRRTVQEGLTNALRHAAAQEVTITLDLVDSPEGQRGDQHQGAWWVLSIVNPLSAADAPDSHGGLHTGAAVDGACAAGAPVPHGLQVRPGFGLAGLADRAGELGGQVDAARAWGCFVLRLSLPATATGPHEEREDLAGQEAGAGRMSLAGAGGPA